MSDDLNDDEAGKNLAEVISELRERIVRQVLTPGQRLVERQIAAEFGVSRAVVRDALSDLTRRHLIVRYPNRGAEVVRLGAADITAIYEVRENIESLCARLATERTQPGDWSDLVELFNGPVAETVRARRFDEYAGYTELLDRRMHAAAGNPVLLEILGTLADRVAVLARRSVYLPERAEQGLVVYRALIDAFNRGDADEAARLKQLNLRQSRDTLLHYEGFVR
ncbi:GntR family transcriptional regulator [Paraburkholderia acidisoli]|uniref:GntR family transcriptional regulator n=1 Tax=Paraburkholderia acidisoli TaxID=2571748 RepID=UPI00131EA310|nr:GntR family transcriptional regulator [Paraburkholderia acidisoli]